MSEWVSTYLYSEPVFYYKLLREFIFSNLTDLNLIIDQNSFFYIRYFDNSGHHIRIRIRVSDGKQGDFIEKYFTDKYQAYILVNPYILPAWIDHSNCIKFRKYEPEFERYGGKLIMPIVEEQFCLSSLTSLHIIKRQMHDKYDLYFQLALNQNLIYILSLNLMNEEIQFMLEICIKAWLPFAYNNIENKSHFLSTEKLSSSCLDLFYTAYLNDEIFIKHYLDRTVQKNKNPNRNKNSYVNKWFKENFIIVNKLKTANKSSPIWCNYMEKFNLCNPIQALAISLIHMNNNRLGIKNQDEAYLAFVLLNYFKTR